MTKLFKVSFLAMLIVAVMAMPAFAGTIQWWNHGGAVNTSLSIALEAMNAARSVSMYGSSTTTGGNVGYSNAALRINPGQALASGSLLTVTFTNAAFGGATSGTSVILCAANDDGNVVTTPLSTVSSLAANTMSQGFFLGAGTTAGQFLFFATSPSNVTNCNLSNAAFSAAFQPVSSATVASVSYNVTFAGGAPYDSKSAVNFATFGKEFATTYTTSTSVIDYADNSSSNGAHFDTGSGNSLGANTAENATALIYDGTADLHAAYSTTVGALLSLQDSANWQGVKQVYLINTGSCNTDGGIPTNLAKASGATLNGTVNLAVNSTAFNGGSANTIAGTVCSDVLANQPLQSRTIKAGYTISAGINDTDTPTTIMTWIPNGYQGMVSYIPASLSTICFLNNKSTQLAPVTVSIISAESYGASNTAIPAALQGIGLGNVPPSGTVRVDFVSGTTAPALQQYTYSGGAETAGTSTTLTGLQTTDRYTAMFNIGGGASSITVNCIQTDPTATAGKRNVPVLTLDNSTTTNWKQ